MQGHFPPSNWLQKWGPEREGPRSLFVQAQLLSNKRGSWLKKRFLSEASVLEVCLACLTASSILTLTLLFPLLYMMMSRKNGFDLSGSTVLNLVLLLRPVSSPPSKTIVWEEWRMKNLWILFSAGLDQAPTLIWEPSSSSEQCSALPDHIHTLKLLQAQSPVVNSFVLP